MNLSPVNSVNFSAHRPIDGKKRYHHKPVQENSSGGGDSISKKKVSGIVLATALAAATLGGVVVHHRASKAEESLRRTYRNALDEVYNSAPYSENRTLKDQVKNLNSNNEALKKQLEALRKMVEETKAKFTDIFEGDVAPKDVRESLLERLRKAINEGDYGYDIANPPVTGKKGPELPIAGEISLPSTVGTSNRANMLDLQIPQVGSDGRFSLELPMGDAKISTMPSKNFKPRKGEIGISEEYSESVRWNSDKVARDIMQNFYDGHGQTLDGVKMAFTPTGNGRYRVRIDGKSTYTPDKAIILGASGKRGDASSAGGYGEGLKMAVIKLLKDYSSGDVKVASDNWQSVFSLAKSDLCDERLLSYSLEKVEPFNGNFVEFETDSMELLQSLRKTVNRFYHSNNPDFKCPDFENDLIGIKVLPKGQKGGIYIAGQRFEFDNDFDGLEGVTVFIKPNLNKINVLDQSRDRISLNRSNFYTIGTWLSRNPNMSANDKAKFLKSLEKYWDDKSYGQQGPMDCLLSFFLGNIDQRDVVRRLHIKFPEKYVAYSNATPEVVYDLRTKGYKVCKSEFADIGMPTIRDLLGDARAHEVVIPNDVQKKKILIVKEVLRKLTPSLEKEHFMADELDAHIYLFDRTSAKDSKTHSDALAEAIVDNGVSKGFWIDKGYLDTAKLSDVLETALHELCHKVGGDESAEFSYKLTDVNGKVLDQLIDDPKLRCEIQALDSLWKEL